MKFLIALIAVFLSLAHVGSACGQPPADLLGWLKMLENDKYRLVSSLDQNGYWFAVRVDSDGDLLFSSHQHDDEQVDDKCVLRVQDAKGNDLHDIDSKKRSPETIKIVSKRQVKIGNVFSETEFTLSYLAGTIYPLKNSKLNEPVDVIYTRHNKDGTTTELFRQRLVRSKNAK